jgi:hypothetical protein
MREYLFKYLVLHKNLSIPKVGVFNIESLSAQIDGTNNLLYPPSQVIRFKQEMVTPDRNFYDFLVAESGMELVDVIKHLQIFTQNLLSEAQEAKGAVLEGIGTLKREHSGHLLFFADRPLEYLFPQVNIDKAISLAKTANLKQAAFKGQELEGDELREFLGQANDVEGGDNWWVYALGLLFLGIGALLFYYV